MKISIIGTGYVGLVTGVCLACKGHEVVCIDIRQDIVDKINKKEPPIYEEGLEELLEMSVSAGKLSATADIESAVMNTEVSVIAVGTPTGIDGSIDLSFIESAARQIGTVIKNKTSYHVVCVKSTVIPGTTDTIVREILENVSGKKAGEFGLAMNPEFLREGRAVEDFMYPDRIVIGAYDDKCFEAMKAVYEGLFDAPVIKVNLRTAEMIKYTANALLATLISFSNEIGLICEKAKDIDADEVFKSVTLDKRFNPRIDGRLVNPGMIGYLKPGCGFGGSCFPKDVKALISYSEALGLNPMMIKATDSINSGQPLKIVDRLEEELGTLAGKKIAVLGLSFKPGTDDVRESPGIAIIKGLLSKGALVFGTDPVAIPNIKSVIPEDNEYVSYSADFNEALKGAHGAVLVTAWEEYVCIPADRYKMLMENPLLLDGRRVIDREALNKEGVAYIGAGLG